MIRKTNKVIVVIVLSIVLSLLPYVHLATANQELEQVFINKMKSEYGEEAYSKFEEEYKARIAELQKWLAKERILERVKKNASFIVMYERILIWVETGQLNQPAEKEAREFLKIYHTRFIDSSLNILEEIKRTAILMEESGLHKFLYEHIDRIMEVAKSPEIKSLLLARETKMLEEIGVTASQFKELLGRTGGPTGIVDWRGIEKVQSEYTEQRIQKGTERREWWKKFAISATHVAIGSALVVGDVSATPVTTGLSALSIAYGSGFIGIGIERLFTLFVTLPKDNPY